MQALSAEKPRKTEILLSYMGYYIFPMTKSPINYVFLMPLFLKLTTALNTSTLIDHVSCLDIHHGLKTEKAHKSKAETLE